MSADQILIATLEKNEADQVRVVLNEFKGVQLCDVRIYSRFSAAKVPMPTKSGLSWRVERLPELIAALQDADAQARARGLTGGAK